MTKHKSTKRALLLSALSLLLCMAMLVGSTFAWFTDSVTSGRNTIVSGQLDVELYYATLKADGTWNDYAKVTANTKMFNENALYEPGYTEMVKFKVVNEGTLALKYTLDAKIYSETAGTNVYNESFNLSNYLYTGIVDAAATRAEAVAAATNVLSAGFNMKADTELAPNAFNEFVLALTMPTTVGNEANHIDGAQPSIDLGIVLVATQAVEEADDFGDDYDENAPYTEVATFAELQAVMTAGGNAILTADIDATQLTPKNQRITVPAGVTAAIDLNGFTFTSRDADSGANAMAIYVDQGAVLTINDSSAAGTGKIASQCYGIYVKQNATLIMNGGTIAMSGNDTFDMGVVLWNGSFVMNGGAIDARYGVAASNYYKLTDNTLPINRITIGENATITSIVRDISLGEASEDDNAHDAIVVDNRA